MQRRLVYANTTAHELRDTLDGNTVDLGTLIAGETLIMGLRLCETLDDNPYLSGKTIHALKASLGRPDMRPETGAVKLHLGSGSEVPGANVTASINCTDTAEVVESKLNTLTDTALVATNLPCVVLLDRGSYIITFKDGTALDIECVENSLWPVSFVEINHVIRDGTNSYEMRFVETPAASTVEFTPVVADPPTITSLVAGNSTTGQEANAVQLLTIPPTFPTAASIIIKRGLKPSALIGLPTSQAEILTALKPLADLGGVFVVTEEQGGILIEFTGTMGKQSQALMTVEIFNAPDGDPTFVLDTNKAEMWALMRRANTRRELALTLSVDIYIEDEITSGIYRLHPFAVDVVFIAPVNRELANVSAALVWNQAPSTTRYAPFSPSNLLITTHAYPHLCGDGSATAYTINHNLGSNYLEVSVRVNADGGRQLKDTEYSVIFTNANACVVTFAVAPTTNQMLVVVRTSDLASTWATGVSWEIADVNGLAEALATQGAAITELQSLIGSGSFATSTTEASQKIVSMSVPLLPKLEVFGKTAALTLEAGKGLAEYAASLPRNGGGLLGAVHASSATTLPYPLVPGSLNTLYQNQTGSAITLPGGYKHRTMTLAANEYAAWDQIWYKVAKEASAEKTYYPVDFNRELVPYISIAANQFRVGFELTLLFGLELVAYNAAVPITLDLVIEHGVATKDTSPSTTGGNLSGFNWNATPILQQQLILGPEPLQAVLGCKLQNLAGGIVGKALAFGGESAPGSVPSTAAHLLRVRLVRFDTVNGSAQRGFLGIRGMGVAPDGFVAPSGITLGTCIIQKI